LYICVQGYGKKYIKLHLNLGRTEVIMGSDRLPVHCHFSLAKPLEQCLIDVTSFRLSKFALFSIISFLSH